MRKPLAYSLAVLLFALIDVRSGDAQPQPKTEFSLSSSTPDRMPSGEKPSIWPDGIGEGFRPAAESFTFGLGASVGVSILGGRRHHALAVASLAYGRTLGNVVGQGHWYRGNFEGRLEIFSGSQFSPQPDWLAGVAPHLRYDFATGTAWVPFVDVGTGVSGTGIGRPDLSGTFEFNVQGSAGTYYFLRPNLALDVDARLLHMSCAGINSPNLGLNTILGTVGLSWFF